MSKHTQGEWVVIGGAAVEIGNRYVIASTNPDNELPRADADLIAAAPDLLKALEELVHAALSRDAIMGDPAGLIEAKHKLSAAAKRGNDLISKLYEDRHELD